MRAGPKSRESSPETFRLGSSQATGRASPRWLSGKHLPRHLWRGPGHTRGTASTARPQPRLGRRKPHTQQGLISPAASVNSHFSNRLHAGDSELGLQLCSRTKANTLLGEAQLCSQLTNPLFQNNESLALRHKSRPRPPSSKSKLPSALLREGSARKAGQLPTMQQVAGVPRPHAQPTVHFQDPSHPLRRVF